MPWQTKLKGKITGGSQQSYSQQIMVTPLGQRIVVLGTAGAGKTTLAQRLALRFDLPHIELDALHWDRDWQMAPLEVFRARVAQAIKGDGWVVDGNYGKVRDLVWGRAETLVWLDYSLGLILWRLIKRGLARSLTQEELWNGNRETLRGQFLSRDSLFLWALKSYNRRRRQYPQLLNQAEYRHLHLIRLPNPSQTERWLEAL